MSEIIHCPHCKIILSEWVDWVDHMFSVHVEIIDNVKVMEINPTEAIKERK